MYSLPRGRAGMRAEVGEGHRRQAVRRCRRRAGKIIRSRKFSHSAGAQLITLVDAARLGSCLLSRAGCSVPAHGANSDAGVMPEACHTTIPFSPPHQDSSRRHGAAAPPPPGLDQQPRGPARVLALLRKKPVEHDGPPCAVGSGAAAPQSRKALENRAGDP